MRGRSGELERGEDVERLEMVNPILVENGVRHLACENRSRGFPWNHRLEALFQDHEDGGGFVIPSQQEFLHG